MRDTPMVRPSAAGAALAAIPQFTQLQRPRTTAEQSRAHVSCRESPGLRGDRVVGLRDARQRRRMQRAHQPVM